MRNTNSGFTVNPKLLKSKKVINKKIIIITFVTILLLLFSFSVSGFHNAPQKAENALAVYLSKYEQGDFNFLTLNKTYKVTKVKSFGYTVEISGSADYGRGTLKNNTLVCSVRAKVNINYFGKTNVSYAKINNHKIED